MLSELKEDLPRLVAMRRELHSNPELSREEVWTSAYVADRLRELGLEVFANVGGHGIVAAVPGAASGPAVALRADMDALSIHEETGLAYASRNSGKMHACGHDGHMAMLLGAAAYLSRTRNFRGTVYLFFQPAEERFGGAQPMLDDGLLDRFPARQIFGLHNWPGLRTGAIVVHDGPVMAGSREFEVTFTARGAHAAMPHLTGDPILSGGHFVTGVQQIVSRAVDPLDAAVVTIGSFRGGHAQNIIPTEARLAGTFRAFKPEVLETAGKRLEEIVSSAAAMAGTSGSIVFDEPGCPPVINTQTEARLMREAAIDLFGASVLETRPPSMAGDDFGVFLQNLPGAYAWVGNGESSSLHLPDYDFNDEILTTGAAFLAATAERALSED